MLKRQLNSEKWDVELGHLFAFGWAMLLLSFLTKEPFTQF